jgi:electron transport complex protein RnfG
LGSNVLDPKGVYMPQYPGKAPSGPLNLTKNAPATPNDIQAVSGATITSRAVSRAVEGSLEFSRSLISQGGVQ